MTTFDAEPLRLEPSRTRARRPEVIRDGYRGAGRLARKTVLITGGDSGISRAVAVHFAAEAAAAVGVVYLEEQEDVDETEQLVTHYGTRYLRIRGDVAAPDCAERGVADFVSRAGTGQIDVLVNNATAQWPGTDLEGSLEHLERTFCTNIYSYFLFTQAALPHMRSGGVIVNTTADEFSAAGSETIDDSVAKRAIMTFTRRLAGSLTRRGIRVNCVAAGPISAPVIPASVDGETARTFGLDMLVKRTAQPSEVAPCYVFLCSRDSSYMTGQILHPNGVDFTA